MLGPPMAAHACMPYARPLGGTPEVWVGWRGVGWGWGGEVLTLLVMHMTCCQPSFGSPYLELMEGPTWQLALAWLTLNTRRSASPPGPRSVG